MSHNFDELERVYRDRIRPHVPDGMLAELFGQALAALHSASHELGDQPNHHRGFADAVRRLERWQAMQREVDRPATTAGPAAVPRTASLPGADPHAGGFPMTGFPTPPGPASILEGRAAVARELAALAAPRPRNGRAYTSEEVGEIPLPGPSQAGSLEAFDIEKALAAVGDGTKAALKCLDALSQAGPPEFFPEPRPPLPEGVIAHDSVGQLWQDLRRRGEAFPEPPVSLEGLGKLATVTAGPLAGRDVGLCAVAGGWCACEMSEQEGGWLVAIERKNLCPWEEVTVVRGDGTSVPRYPGEGPWGFLARVPAPAGGQP